MGRKDLIPIVTTFYLFSIISTVPRLIYRVRCRKLWWDDFWAAVAMISNLLLCIIYLLLQSGHSGSPLVIFIASVITSKVSLWASRLSVAVTIVRIIATGKAQLVSKIVAFLFGIFTIVVIVQKLVLCNPLSRCRSYVSVTAYSELSAGFLADIWLLVAPAYFLWKMKLKKQFHRLLQAIFACEVFVLVESILHCVYIVRGDDRSQKLVAHLRSSTSLIVCNLLFLVTYIYRSLRAGEETKGNSTSSTLTSTATETRNYQSQLPGTVDRAPTPLTPLTSVDMYSSSNTDPVRSVHASDPGRGGFNLWSRVTTVRFASSA